MAFTRAMGCGVTRPAGNQRALGIAAPPNYRRHRGMNLWRPSLLDVMTDLQNIHSTMESHFPGTQDRFRLNTVRRMPVRVSEDENSFKITAEVPGIRKQDVSIEIEDRTLTISVSSYTDNSSNAKQDDSTDTDNTADSDEAVKEEGKEAVIVHSNTEWEYESRAFQLPESADESGVSAVCENGLLCITIPKLISSQPTKRSITIE